LEQSDLEGLLDEALQVDFNVQAEDDSPYQVARSLVNMHNQVASGEVSYIETLRQLQPVSSTACQQEARPNDPEASEDSSSSEGEGEDEGDDSEGEAMEVEGSEEMETEDSNALRGPIIDEDGFQLVQRKGKGRR
jgi:pre-rRNA-processing protein TSR2